MKSLSTLLCNLCWKGKTQLSMHAPEGHPSQFEGSKWTAGSKTHETRHLRTVCTSSNCSLHNSVQLAAFHRGAQTCQKTLDNKPSEGKCATSPSYFCIGDDRYCPCYKNVRNHI